MRFLKIDERSENKKTNNPHIEAFIFWINLGLYKSGVLSFWTKANRVAPHETPHTLCLHEFHHKNKIKMKIKEDPDASNNQNGPAQLIRMGKSIRHIWVK